MNDRFSAQLRQHLLHTANERPAEGQLAAVLQRVAVTGQRPSIAARLLWNPGRIGPFPWVAMRYGLIVLALVLAGLALVLLGGAGPSARTSFEGTWTSIDPADGSTQTLVVGAGDSPSVHLVDDVATGAACVNDAVKRFTADGTGQISGTRLHATFPNGGGCGLLTVAVAGVYDYEVATDTLLDQDGVTWVRVRGDGSTGTQLRR